MMSMANPLKILDAEEADLKATISRSQERLDYIKELRKKYPPKSAKAKEDTPLLNGVSHSETSELPSPSKAITAFLAENPGSKRKDILKSLVGRVKTTSKNPPTVIRTILG